MGKSTGFVQLIDLPRPAAIHQRRYNCNWWTIRYFPENINIGTIDKIYIDKQTNYYTLSISYCSMTRPT